MTHLSSEDSLMHNGEKRFKCSVCNYGFTDKYVLKTHIDSVHNGIRQNCSFCDASFATKFGLKRHIGKSNF